jgi:alanine dehydrogenase
MVDILILSRREAEQVFTMRDALEAVEAVYRAQGERKVINPMATSFVVPGYNGEVDIKSAYIEPMNCSGLKFAGGYWDNPVKYGLPSVIGIILLADGSNGLRWYTYRWL